jgi:hypothetical protein
MKKILGILLIAGSLVACNNSSESTTSPDSTNQTTTDSLNAGTGTTGTTMDSTNRMGDTTHTAGSDSTSHK